MRTRRPPSLRATLNIEESAPRESSALFWNINLAADPERLSRIGAVLRSRRAAVVGLSEVPWTRDAFVQRAYEWGYNHSLLLRKNYRFNMGLLSTTPLVRVAASYTTPFFHGALCGALPAYDGLMICVTHLTPHKLSTRLAEAHAVLQLIESAAGRTATASSTRVLLLGDLNALSPRDAPAHAASALSDKLSKSVSWSKFASKTAGLDYSVLTALTARRFGW